MENIKEIEYKGTTIFEKKYPCTKDTPYEEDLYYYYSKDPRMGDQEYACVTKENAWSRKLYNLNDSKELRAILDRAKEEAKKL